jgi:hypothetical protein
MSTRAHRQPLGRHHLLLIAAGEAADDLRTRRAHAQARDAAPDDWRT